MKKGEYSVEEGMAALERLMPSVMTPFGNFRDQVTKDGLLSAKTKRLMMVAVAVAQRCEFCIRAHIKGSVELGASRAEILEAVGVAVLMAGGPAAAHAATVVLDALEEEGA